MSDNKRPIECPECGHELSTYTPPPEMSGERAAAWFAGHVATWWFPALILAGVAIWAIVNIIAQPLEPYPVVVLAWISAVLATVAACQGPLILLAQRRAAMNDRARDEEAFRVNTNVEADVHELRRAIDELRREGTDPARKDVLGS
ncbi:MAG: DUF1003 domain-containing protein [Acidimicrobiales bacterium]